MTGDEAGVGGEDCPLQQVPRGWVEGDVLLEVRDVLPRPGRCADDSSFAAARACQKNDWKSHKLTCGKRLATDTFTPVLCTVTSSPTTLPSSPPLPQSGSPFLANILSFTRAHHCVWSVLDNVGRPLSSALPTSALRSSAPKLATLPSRRVRRRTSPCSSHAWRFLWNLSANGRRRSCSKKQRF